VRVHARGAGRWVRADRAASREQRASVVFHLGDAEQLLMSAAGRLDLFGYLARFVMVWPAMPLG
jgi:hypothetical protein